MTAILTYVLIGRLVHRKVNSHRDIGKRESRFRAFEFGVLSPVALTLLIEHVSIILRIAS